jgi:superfamily II DNA or RNA helicase
MPDSGHSFGYLPDARKSDDVLSRRSFRRALSIDTPVKDAVGRVPECRILWNPRVELPSGVYWFEGLDDGALVVQIGGGGPPSGGMNVELGALTEEHPLAAAWRWAEELWIDAEPVPGPEFNINEDVVTDPGDVDAMVLDRRFHSDEWSYTVSIGGRRQTIAGSRLKLRPQVDDPLAWVTGEPTPADRFGATLTRAKLHGKLTDTLFSFRATRTTFRPYQFKPVLKLLQTGKARLLIADEVGLGKTIEAGLIWTELEARQEADRVLVVCPSSLLNKWKEEMADRFEFELRELDTKGLDDFLDHHRANRLPARGAYICSLERLRSWPGIDELRDLPPEFDLVVVDEAHAMRNRSTKSYALGTEISDWADSLVFLTATPINLHQADLSNLLELLAPEDYGDISDLELRLEPNRIINAVTARLTQGFVDGLALIRDLEKLRSTRLGGAVMDRPDYKLLVDILQDGRLEPRNVIDAKRLLAELNTLSTVITRTKKVEVDDRKAKRTEDRQPVSWRPAEIEFYNEYVRWCRSRAAELDSPLYFAMQMPLRLASACLPMARRAVLDPVGFGRITDADSDEAVDRLEPHPELVQAALRLPVGVDTKFDQLRQVLERLHSQGRRALVFTFSVPTLMYLEERVSDQFKVAVMYGGVNRERRRQIMAEFRAGEYDFVFANRVASEGLDFEFCSAVINYDLPWNPMEIEQRIGRIDRIGQEEETILVVNFVNDETIDERILVRLLDRIAIFESSIGALEPIIAANAPKALQAGFDFTLNAQQREQKVHEVLLAIEEQRAGVRDVSDASGALLVTNDVDVAGLEEDLVRTGRYVGQHELAFLIHDWARVEGAQGMRFGADRRTVGLRGNAGMASRVDELAVKAKRTRSETGPVSKMLRDELSIPFPTWATFSVLA